MVSNFDVNVILSKNVLLLLFRLSRRRILFDPLLKIFTSSKLQKDSHLFFCNFKREFQKRMLLFSVQSHIDVLSETKLLRAEGLQGRNTQNASFLISFVDMHLFENGSKVSK